MATTPAPNFEQLARYRPDITDAATAWALDCEWGDDVEGCSAELILRSVHHHYGGGLDQLCRDSDLPLHRTGRLAIVGQTEPKER